MEVALLTDKGKEVKYPGYARRIVFRGGETVRVEFPEVPESKHRGGNIMTISGVMIYEVGGGQYLPVAIPATIGPGMSPVVTLAAQPLA